MGEIAASKEPEDVAQKEETEIITRRQVLRKMEFETLPERETIEEEIIREPTTDVVFEEKYPSELAVSKEPEDVAQKEETEIITRRQVLRKMEIETLPERETIEE